MAADSFKKGPRGLRRSSLPAAVVIALALALLVRTWLVEGLFLAVVVPSGSMAPTLLGPHRTVTCTGCGWSFPWEGVGPAETLVACPNCGWLGPHQISAVAAGDRLLLDKAVFRFRQPRRWEVAAFRHPHQSAELVVKRVVGLPGESVRIAHGNVFINGEIQRKPLGRQRAVTQLVHDAAFRPPGASHQAARWQADEGRSSWRLDAGCFRIRADSGEELDWVSYRHGRPLVGRPPQTDPSPVTDDSPVDPGRPRRREDRHAVTDLLLAFRVARIAGAGVLAVRASDGREEFEVHFPFPGGGVQVFHDDRPVALAEPAHQEAAPLPAGGSLVEVSLFDRQLLVALDGRTLFSHPFAAEDAPPGTDRPFAIGAARLAAEIEAVRIYRDIYYTRPIGLEGRWGVDEEFPLGDGEYFVLGDHSPFSADSRTWPQGPAVPESLLVGRPLIVHCPMRPVTWGGWRFQVPDSTRIRYIR